MNQTNQSVREEIEKLVAPTQLFGIDTGLTIDLRNGILALVEAKQVEIVKKFANSIALVDLKDKSLKSHLEDLLAIYIAKVEGQPATTERRD